MITDDQITALAREAKTILPLLKRGYSHAEEVAEKLNEKP